MDKTVRLWHVSRRECLCCFQHIDFVTAIAFHPKVIDELLPLERVMFIRLLTHSSAIQLERCKKYVKRGTCDKNGITVLCTSC